MNLILPAEDGIDRRCAAVNAARVTILERDTFEVLVARDPDLAVTRQEYQNKPPADRRMAAEWEYDRGVAEELTAPLFGNTPVIGSGAVLALAIDPDFGPAMLTVGSIEYQLGRRDEAMALFLRLTELPADTEDLFEMIDKAGDFLIDRGAIDDAQQLYEAAVGKHPGVALLHAALGYCHGKSRRFAEAVAETRKAVEIEPHNHEHLSDLGWSLVKAGQYDEARKVLLDAVAASPPDYETARANLKYLDSLQSG